MGTTPTPESGAHELTELLHEASNGNVDALNRLFPLVYDELRRLASRRLRAEREGHTLSTTALVHEAYLKLVDQTRVQWRSRAHFYAVSSHAMRRILSTYGKRRRAAKRGAGGIQLTLEDAGIAIADNRLDELVVAVKSSRSFIRRTSASSWHRASIPITRKA
jgi:RNA polymerase sigma factor (TIGR02999 family)